MRGQIVKISLMYKNTKYNLSKTIFIKLFHDKTLCEQYYGTVDVV